MVSFGKKLKSAATLEFFKTSPYSRWFRVFMDVVSQFNLASAGVLGSYTFSPRVRTKQKKKQSKD